MKQDFAKKSVDAYVAPALEVISIESEGVIALSGGGTTEVVTPSDMGSSTGVYRNASSSDFEDMINDILTVGE